MAATHPLPRGGTDFMTQRRLFTQFKSQWFSNDAIEAECLVVDINSPTLTGNGMRETWLVRRSKTSTGLIEEDCGVN